MYFIWSDLKILDFNYSRVLFLMRFVQISVREFWTFRGKNLFFFFRYLNLNTEIVMLKYFLWFKEFIQLPFNLTLSWKNSPCYAFESNRSHKNMSERNLEKTKDEATLSIGDLAWQFWSYWECEFELCYLTEKHHFGYSSFSLCCFLMSVLLLNVDFVIRVCFCLSTL